MKKPCNYCQPNRPRPPKKICCKGVEIDYVEIPVSAGTDAPGQPLAPENGAHKNAVVRYAANDHTYIYTSEGIPVQISWGRAEDVAVFSVNGKTGDVVLTTADIQNNSDYQNGTEVLAAINSAIAALATVARTGAYNDLQGKPTIPTKVSQLQNDSGYQTASQVSSAIGIETTAREGADANLQGQIDALSAASDVTDIVGTYAALQAYDTSKLKDNDIIKVLQDETHDDETTYYRWSTATQTFTLIGEEGPYYTKGAADQKFQDKLTAGANITIDANNEISATDTTYSAMTGATASTAGTSGLVPAPAAGDQDKALRGDGTWGDIPTETIFYANLNETGNNRHIYKDIAFTTAASVQELIDANNEGQVILRGTSAANPTAYSDAYLQNAFIMPHNNDFEFVFLDRDLRYEYTASATTDTVFFYSTSEIQPKLTAGTNINISGTAISATDTTYSDFTGTDGQTAGTAGLVPAPATTDAGKYLKADGTWSVAGGDIITANEAGASLTVNGTWVQDNAAGIYKFQNGVTFSFVPGNQGVDGAYSFTLDTNSTPAYGILLNGYGSGRKIFHLFTMSASSPFGTIVSINVQNSVVQNVTDYRALDALSSSLKYRPLSANRGRQLNENKLAVANLLAGAGVELVTAGSGANQTVTVKSALDTGTTAPTTSTAGSVGSLYAYVTSGTGHLAICTEVDTTDPDNPSYTWQTLV